MCRECGRSCRLPELDPAFIEVMRMVGAAVFGATAGGIVSEWRAREADKRADTRDRRRLRQDALLRAISETQRDYIAASDWLLRWLAGDEEGLKSVRHGPGDYPEANLYLLGDESLIRQVVDLRKELHEERKFGSGLSAHDAARLGALQGHVSARLAAQRDRVIEGQEPIWPSKEFVRSLVDAAADRYGISPEMRPPMAD
jgi:hypothetical protein